MQHVECEQTKLQLAKEETADALLSDWFDYSDDNED